ncbi:hypothetical protein IU449_27175 [Nocardia higoensis]|uniref:Uncharacterized protein n=1 Tax=Nocardia higoensis TaxID=228599 RepID=A0ABS0DNB9_9NOCA|nr:hypothetical protein [Nocardia higoensis]MBF6358183.1 hypothetical protein [Nocardia higoensis]
MSSPSRTYEITFRNDEIERVQADTFSLPGRPDGGYIIFEAGTTGNPRTVYLAAADDVRAIRVTENTEG